MVYYGAYNQRHNKKTELHSITYSTQKYNTMTKKEEKDFIAFLKNDKEVKKAMKKADKYYGINF